MKTQYEMRYSRTASKVKASAAGAGIGGALALLVVWLLRTIGIEVPAQVEAAIVVVMTPAATWLAGYLKRPHALDSIVRAPS